MRLFVAVAPPPELLDRVAREVERKRSALPRARWVRREHLHLTLAFLGEVDAARIDALASALSARVGERRRVQARLAGAGAFPAWGPARVVWAGFEPEAELVELAAAVRRAVGEAGLECDEKPFRAHLTLARCPERWPPETRAALPDLLAEVGRSEFEVDRVVLIESVLGPDGPTYTTRAEAPLAVAT